MIYSYLVVWLLEIKAKVGSRGQIVIPKPIREMFHIQPGENMFFSVIKKDIHIRKQEGTKILNDMISRIEKKKAEPKNINWKEKYYAQFDKNKWFNEWNLDGEDMNYIDSNVFLYPILYQGKKTDNAKKILKEMVNGDIACATSSLTLDEVIWVIMNETHREKALQIGKDIMTLPNLKILDVTNKHILLSISLMEKYKKLRPRDAIHLAVCTTAGIFRFITDDADFDHISEINRISLWLFTENVILDE